MIHVLAYITTKPGQRATVLDAFNANVPKVLDEDGCLEYAAAVDSPDAGPVQTEIGPDSFVVVEKWRDNDALAAHLASAHMKTYAAAVGDLLERRVIHVLAPV